MTAPIPSTKADAEILKLVAEAESAREEAALHRIDQTLKGLEVEKLRANVLEAQHDAALRGITLNERKRMEDLAVIQDHYVFHHYFDGFVGEKSVYAALNTLAAWDRAHPDCDMNITINSPGGSVIDGMHLFDQLTAYSRRKGGRHKVTITVRGYAASMAAILLQAADERVIGPESYLLVHEVSAGASGKIGELKDDLKWYEKMCDRIAHIFVERSSGLVTAEQFKSNWERKDWWLDSEESLELGFVDRIG